MHRPIGLFDSGFGGLTVMKELVKILPHEDIIYLGDTAHLPYGNKSAQTVLERAFANANFLLKQNIKLLVIPCHTACSHALKALQEKLPIPVLGVIEAGLELIQEKSHIAILATQSTIDSGIYQSLLTKTNPQAKVFAISCPLFVPLIENGFHNHYAAKLIAHTYLKPIKDKVDTVLLGCTHYPLMQEVLQQVLPLATFVQPALLCGEKAQSLLTEINLLNQTKQKPSYKFYVSDDPEKFRHYGKIFFGQTIQNVEKNALP